MDRLKHTVNSTYDGIYQCTTKPQKQHSDISSLRIAGKEKITISNVALFLVDPKNQLSVCFQSAK